MDLLLLLPVNQPAADTHTLCIEPRDWTAEMWTGGRSAVQLGVLHAVLPDGCAISLSSYRDQGRKGKVGSWWKGSAGGWEQWAVDLVWGRATPGEVHSL